ncbi:RlpA-like double-psi beta-barrel-protein domain-containing protein-containing protein [Trametes elegans]|nr:RlpA-like double-psi beta-barrel-protein domain-containing protein-containing protein [Trametes elegans]
MFAKTIFSTILVAVLASGVQAYSGDATYYYPNGGYGACGTQLQNTDYIVALNPVQYSSGANCGRRINVQYQGKSVQATVADLCPGCGSGGVDLSPVAFEQLAPLSAGRIQVTWDFV